MGNKFDDLRKSGSWDLGGDGMDAETRFENSTVKFILGKLGVPKMAQVLRADAAERTGHGHLTCEAFCERFPTFPFYLGTKYIAKLHRDESCTLVSLLGNFRQARFVRAFEDFADRVPDYDNRSIGLVFPRQGYQRGLILHMGHDFWMPKTTRLVFSFGSEDKRRSLVLEPFGQLVTFIAKEGIVEASDD